MVRWGEDNVLLEDEDGIRELILGYVRSRDWWMIPYVTEAAADFAIAFERRFYAGKKNADFHLLLGPGLPGFAVAFGHKRRARPAQVSRFFRELGGVADIAVDNDHDILLPVVAGEARDQMMRNMLAFEAWVYRTDRRN